MADPTEQQPETQESPPEPREIPDASNCPLVLVTGATGFIANHIIYQLLHSGKYRVRGTVRNLKDDQRIDPLRHIFPEAKPPLELVEADLMQVDSWREAVKDCTYVIHLASPVPTGEAVEEDKIIKPAVEGTQHILRACKENPSVKRVVYTSSIAAISGLFLTKDVSASEADWLDDNEAGQVLYTRSKLLSERAAWEFMKKESDNSFELAVINPSMVMGPVTCDHIPASVFFPKQCLERYTSMIAHLHFPFVDVRDVAAAHIRAMTIPEAAGKRHILHGHSMWLDDIAKILAAEFKPQGYNVPTMTAPYFIMKMMSFFYTGTKSMLPSIGKTVAFDTSRMTQILGINPVGPRYTLLDTCYSMIEAGMIMETDDYNGPPGMQRAEDGGDDPAAAEEGLAGEEGAPPGVVNKGFKKDDPAGLKSVTTEKA